MSKIHQRNDKFLRASCTEKCLARKGLILGKLAKIKIAKDWNYIVMRFSKGINKSSRGSCETHMINKYELWIKLSIYVRSVWNVFPSNSIKENVRCDISFH